MKTRPNFENEIKKIDDRFTIENNPNRPGLANIFFEGRNYDLPVISANEIKDEVDNGYRYEFPSGMSARFWAKDEVLDRLKNFIQNLDKIKKEYDL